MTAGSAYRVLSWLCVVGLGAFGAWITVAPFGWVGTPIAVTAMLGLVLATLKIGVRKPVDYWEAVTEPDQAPRVLMLIVICLTIQLIIGAVVQVAHQMSMTAFWSDAVYFLAWIIAPLAMIGVGIVRWPQRRASPANGELFPVAVAGILVATGLGYLGFLAYDGPRLPTTPAQLVVGGGFTLLAATMEEVVYRVLLLTALVTASGSRNQAPLLSSVVFAVAHLPPAVAGAASSDAQLCGTASTTVPLIVAPFGAAYEKLSPGSRPEIAWPSGESGE